MFAIREFRIFVRCAVAQLLCGNESLAHGPRRYAVLDARPKIAYIKYRAIGGGIVITWRGILLRAWARELHRRARMIDPRPLTAPDFNDAPLRSFLRCAVWQLAPRDNVDYLLQGAHNLNDPLGCHCDDCRNASDLT